MTVPPLRVVGEAPPPDPEPSGQFFLIVADHDRGFFSVEGPMTDDLPWQAAARRGRSGSLRRGEMVGHDGVRASERDLRGASEDRHRPSQKLGESSPKATFEEG